MRIIKSHNLEELQKYEGKTIDRVVKTGDCFKLIFPDGTFIEIKDGVIGYEGLPYLLMDNGELKAA